MYSSKEKEIYIEIEDTLCIENDSNEDMTQCMPNNSSKNC